MDNANKFSEKQFLFFIFNYIVGFGFISTISNVIKLGYLGIVVFFMTSIITLSTSLVFSRLAQSYKDEYGGSYNYSKKAFNKKISFFQGWNQFIQGPILSATSPLFIASSLEPFINNEKLMMSVRIISILIFILLVLISIQGIRTSKKIIFASSIIKWLVLGVGLIITFVLSIQNMQFKNNLINSTNSTTYSIFAVTLSFMYAFGGFEDVSSMSKDVETNKFRKLLLISFSAILSIYFIFFILLNGLNLINNFIDIYNISLGVTGIVIFILGIIFNSVSNKISVNIANARKIIPLSLDGYLPKILAKQNNKGEYRNAILFNAFLTITSMIIFWLLPQLLNLESFFSNVIELGSVAFLIQYILTLITGVVLHYKKKINIPLWERIIYFVGILIIFSTLLIFLIPPIVNKNWEIQNTITIVSYASFISIGYILIIIKWIYFKYFYNKKFNIK